MKKIVFIFLLLNIPFILFSQDNNQNQKTKTHYRSNYLSTDFLSLLNSFISSERTIYLTGEMCVDHSIGFRINIFHIRDHSTGYIRNAIGAGPEIRLYKIILFILKSGKSWFRQKSENKKALKHHCSGLFSLFMYGYLSKRQLILKVKKISSETLHYL